VCCNDVLKKGKGNVVPQKSKLKELGEKPVPNVQKLNIDPTGGGLYPIKWERKKNAPVSEKGYT